MVLIGAGSHNTKEGKKILNTFAENPVENVKIVVAKTVEKGKPLLKKLMMGEDVRKEASK